MEKRKSIPIPLMQEIEVEIQNVGPISWSTSQVCVGGVHVVKDNGIGWLRWLLKQGAILQAY
jgi:hypothetical protein